MAGCAPLTEAAWGQRGRGEGGRPRARCGTQVRLGMARVDAVRGPAARLLRLWATRASDRDSRQTMTLKVRRPKNPVSNSI